MNQFIELLINGISLGFVYALVALGFVVVFKSTRVINFAHGVDRAARRLPRSRSSHDGPRLRARRCSPAPRSRRSSAALLYLVILRHVKGRAADTVTIATIGVDIILATELARQIGQASLNIGDPWRDGIVTLRRASRCPRRASPRRSSRSCCSASSSPRSSSPAWGVAMRAAAEDGEAAALMGIRLPRVAAGAWLVAGALATVGGVFLTTFPTPGVDRTTGLAAISAFPAAILGGLDSVVGAVVGGLIIGIVVTMSVGLPGRDLVPRPRARRRSRPTSCMVLVLLVRPVRPVRHEGADACLSGPAPASARAGAVRSLLLAIPFYLEAFWLQTGLFAMAAAIGAIGLTILDRHGRAAVARARVLRRRRRVRLLLLRRRRRASASTRRAASGCRRSSRWSSRSRSPGLAGALFSPDLRPPARHLPRHRVDRPGLHRPAHPLQRLRRDRRLQRARRGAVQPLRLLLHLGATPS